ncbi:hypothetical protein AUJ73_02265 [Candidatus Gottesmanbacteria bacterium CG1_02_37_22]|uniref:Phosphopantothenate/pantothenate synthetase n=1 Tax=Candidatus Gottesmanbacteria bacterium CG1_02_37_22 TaxID=1805209 RepID=A0A1J4TUX0_9BACT|nr:MAG: hypothetical protein AUJ73_02265 [Candidatus Gottesmanbacteria bacterium CG1_02_37_22]
MKINAPKSHPRYLSNLYRDKLAYGVKLGITSLQGLTAHGRGEAFDYLLGEKTNDFAKIAIKVATCMLITARHPVISVNGNTAILAPAEIITLANLTNASIEVNLFHASKKRENNIVHYLKKLGAGTVLLPNKGIIPGIDSNRRMISKEGQKDADVILVPLEDGDRTGALVAMGKKVIAIDLNPLSRTAKRANVTIVDNLVRVIPDLICQVKIMRSYKKEKLISIIDSYDNHLVLEKALIYIARRLTLLSRNSDVMV